MERFHLKVTFVFLVTILLPSMLLCFFALQAVNVEQQQQRLSRRARAEQRVDTLATELDAAFEEPRQDVVTALEQARGKGLDEVIRSLRELESRSPVLSQLAVFDNSGRIYPRANERAASPLDQRPLNVNSPGAVLGLGSAGLVRLEPVSLLLDRADAEFATGRHKQALALLQPLTRHPLASVQAAASLKLANFLRYLGESKRALAILEQGRSIDVATPAPMGEADQAVAADMRLELAMLYSQDSDGDPKRAQKIIDELIRELEKELPRVSPAALGALARRAAITLEVPESAFSALIHSREAMEKSARDLALDYGRLIDAELRRASRGLPAASSDALSLAAAGGPSPREPRYFKKPSTDRYEVILYAPIFESDEELIGLCVYRVDLEFFVARRLTPLIQSRNVDPEARFVATNPLYEHDDARPLFDEDADFSARRLREPLDHIQLRGFEKRLTPAIRLAASQARLHVWLITVAMVGITLGAIVTVWTVLREARAAQLKTDFVANVTHELKTPLTSIRMFIETLELDHVANEEERQECLAIMARETDRLTRLIDRLLAFSKLDRRQWKFRLTYEEPARLIQEAIDLYRNQHGARDVEVKVESLQSPKVAVDREAMVEVIYNLLHNAVKYTPAQQRDIRVTVAERRRDIIISVNDNGVGVPRRDRQRIFRKFERGSYAEKAQIQGSGIGLTLARSIVRGHGGELSYQPNKPQGSRFVISLPK